MWLGTQCTGLWCVPHPMYWSMVCFSPHVLVYGVFLTPCTGLWCVPHPMYCSMVCSSPQNETHVLLLSLTLPPSVPASYSSSEAPPSVGKAPSPTFQVLSGKHHTQLLEMTRNAADRWLAIGIELGFKNNELDDMLPTSRSHLYEESRYYGDEMYYGDDVCYAAMLKKWLDWEPPNHSPPTLSALVAAMHAVGMERVAYDLERWGKQL